MWMGIKPHNRPSCLQSKTPGWELGSFNRTSMKEQVIPGLYDATLASTGILQTISEHSEDKVKKNNGKHLKGTCVLQPPKY